MNTNVLDKNCTPIFSIRRATVEDAEVIGFHRRRMFFDMGFRDDAELDRMIASFLPWLRRRMEIGEYIGWFAVAQDRSVAAGLGLWLMDWAPHLVGPGSPRGNIINVYTRPDCRRQGLARALMDTGLGWCRENGIRCVVLHASEEGRPLYESLGFQATNEMRLMM